MTKKTARSQTQTQMNSQFWKAFAKNIWEKKAVVYADIQSPLRQIDDKRIFEMLVEYSDYCRKVGRAEGMKLFLEGEKQYEQDVLQFLPVRKDKTLLGYHARMEALFPDYCLVCDELLEAKTNKRPFRFQSKVSPAGP